MNNLSLRIRISLLINLPMLGVFILSFLLITESQSVQSEFSELTTQNFPIVKSLEELKVNGSRLISSVNEYVLDEQLGLEEDEEDGEEGGEAAQIEEAKVAYTNALNTYRDIVETVDHSEDPNEIHLLEDIESATEILFRDVDIILELQEEGEDIEEIAEAREELEEAEVTFLEAVDEALDEEEEELLEKQADVAQFTANNTNIAVAVVVLIILVVSIISFYIIQSILRPLKTMTDTMEQVRKGDLSVRNNIKSTDEFGNLATTFDEMTMEIERNQLKLQEMNTSLEKRVAERTDELKTARDEALVAKRIADENSRLKSEFLSMMSHELRTPMNAIQGFTDIILARMAGVDYNDRAERYLHKIQSNSSRLLGLINDFLDLSRIESGRLELAHMPIVINELAQSWTDLLSVLAENKGLDLGVEVGPHLPKTIYGDEESMTKIVVNLLGNAIKFTDEGSVKLNMRKQEDNLIIEVTDTGIGIPPHAREFIFDEFRQVDMTSKRKHGGTGLGLSIVQKLAVAMGGTVSVQSEVGVGSTFTVSIPLQLQPQLAS